MDLPAYIVLTGVSATALTDAWGIVRRALFGVRPPDFGLVGRWIGHLARGRFHHDSIAAASPVRGEAVIGWMAHYLIGIAFASLLPMIWGAQWFEQPTLLPTLVVGVGTVMAPFLIMQPGMGAGVAASRTPRPGIARLHSVLTHAIFGVGLYCSGEAVSKLLTGV